MKRHLYFLVLATALAPALVPAYADNDDDHRQRDSIDAAVKKGEIMQLSEILLRVKPQINGRVLEVEFEDSKEGPVYEFYVLDSIGRRIEYKIDARTARILSSEQDD